MVEPKLRLQGYNDEWKSIRMDELFEEIVEKGQIDLPVLSVKQGYGTVLRDESDRNIQYDKANLKGYKVIRKNDFIIHLRSFEGGLECSNHDGISSPAYKILRTDKLNPDLYRHYFRSYKFIEGKLGPAVVGIRDGRNIEMSTFWDTKLNVPSIEEQNEMAKVITSVDEVTSILAEEVRLWEEKKKGVMQKIFSQEVRFKNENGEDYPEWEEKSVGSLMTVTSVKRVHQEDWTKEGVPFYRAREIVSLHNGEQIEPLFISRELYEKYSVISGKIREGDLLVTGVGTIGIQYLIKENDEFYFKDGNIIWLKNSENNYLEGLFLYYLYDSDYVKKQIRNMAGIGTVATYTIEGVKKTLLPLPCLEEQQKIADCLSSIDEVIAVKKQKLETWKNIKKGLLQQMFV